MRSWVSCLLTPTFISLGIICIQKCISGLYCYLYSCMYSSPSATPPPPDKTLLAHALRGNYCTAQQDTNSLELDSYSSHKQNSCTKLHYCISYLLPESKWGNTQTSSCCWSLFEVSFSLSSCCCRLLSFCALVSVAISRVSPLMIPCSSSRNWRSSTFLYAEDYQNWNTSILST